MSDVKDDKKVVKLDATRRKAKSVADPSDPRPTIRIVAGEIERIVDQGEAALIKSAREIFQRDNRIVSVAAVPAIAAHGREVVAQRIFEKGDHSLLEDLACAAIFEKFDARAKGFVIADPPMAVVRTMRERTGRLRFPILSGVVNCPTLRADGSIVCQPGYDPATGLLFDPRGVEFPPVADQPTPADAEDALALINGLLSEFPFVTDKDRSVALSAILTGCIRRSLATAPLHAFSAPLAGSGKSLLVDIVSTIATGHECPVIAQGQDETEFEKRFSSCLMAGDAIIAIDNCEQPLGGQMICQALTQMAVKPRILGKSENPTVSGGAFVTATGNNLIIVGDLTRRTLLCRLDPKHERPETREFKGEPVADAKARRPAYVAAVLTILRAYHVAGRPNKPTPLGSFTDYSDLVRGALIWLGAADPVETMDELRTADPRLGDLRAVASQWAAVVGAERVVGGDVIKRANARHSTYEGNEFLNPEFREALLAVAGRGGTISARALGKWLGANQDRIVDGLSFKHCGTRQGAAVWSLLNSNAPQLEF
jgi:putative DNA primase/helicase